MCPQITADTTLRDFIEAIDFYINTSTGNLRAGWTGTGCVITGENTYNSWTVPTEVLMDLYVHRLEPDLYKGLNLVLLTAQMYIGGYANENDKPLVITHREELDPKDICESAEVPYTYKAWLGAVCGYILSKYEYTSVQTVKCSPDEKLDAVDENYGILCQKRDKMNLGVGIDVWTLRSIYNECGNSLRDWQLKIDQTLHYRLLSIIESHYVTNSGVVS